MTALHLYLKKNFSHKYANSFLGILWLVDVLFISIHIAVGAYIFFNDLDTWAFFNSLLVTTEGGYSEYFQYLKYLMIIGCITYLILHKRKYGYTLWLILFVVFLLDDAFQFHERVGLVSSQFFGFKPILGMRGRDLGELAYAASVGTVFLTSATLNYMKSSLKFRRTSFDIVLLVGLFLFFGIGLDLAHAISGDNRYLGFIFGLLEDGGEMLVLSLLSWYFFFLVLRNSGRSAYLFVLFSKGDKA